MKKKPVTALLMALTLTAALSACGNVDSESAWKSIESEVESEGLETVKDEEPEEGEIETATEEVTEESEDESEVTEVTESEEVSEEVDESEEAVEVVESEEAAKEVVESKDAVESKTDKTDKTEKPKTETSPKTDASANTSESSAPEQPSAPEQSEVPVSTPAPTPAPTLTPTPEPVHEHSWKEHVATTQVWVPNVVVVDDYETRYVEVGSHYICACGQCETDDPDIISNHVKESVRANDGLSHNFTIWSRYGEETVRVGSHEEDQGHYDTSSYVDYYYCDCGATK